MSTVEHPEPKVLPPLVHGQRLDQPTFQERHAAMGEGKWFELIGGVVFMVPAVFAEHGMGDGDLAGWLFHYQRFTPGTRSFQNVSTVLGEDCEVQPDSQLRILEEFGGLARVDGGYIVGPPGLVVEVGASSLTLDRREKKAAYERAGAPEYLSFGVDPREVLWFILRDGRYVELEPGAHGLLRPVVFPGLWLDPAALIAGDLNVLIGALDRGIASPEHADFVARLAARRAGS